MARILKRISNDYCFRTYIFSTELNSIFSREYSDRSYGSQQKSTNFKPYYAAAGVISALGASYYLLKRKEKYVLAGEAGKFGLSIAGLPTYGMSEVSKHCNKDKGIWVTYKEGVYDITKFVEQHPGGDKIMMAAGGSLEPFWLLYSVHKTPEVFGMLEQFRIGNLVISDVLEAVSDDDDPYNKDPRRHPALKPASEKPFNAEPPLEVLVDSFLTPQDLFYVRNHLPVPDVSLDDYELEVSGVGIRCKTFTMKDIQKMPTITITAAVQCAGNRRSEMTKVKPVKGLSWGQAAIGNATWTGVKLCDVLRKMGVDENTKARHVQFEGLDTDPASMPYGASIPIQKALDPAGGVILAYKMNGEQLSRDHGYPLRVIVPGVTGARNVKWLSKIIVSEEESDSHWQQRDYKGFSPSVDWDTVDFSKSPAIQELPVTSAICSPLNDSTVNVSKNGTIPLKGYAWSGGGRKIVRVDVTCDEGKTWHTAGFVDQDSAEHPSHWGWTLWQIDLPVPKTKSVEVWVKAVDSNYNTQPESFKHIWNLRGVLSNAYHKIKINLK